MNERRPTPVPDRPESVENTPVPLSALNPSPMTGAGNNTWLLDGAEPTLIDAGVGVPAHVDAIARALGGRALARVLITHGHADHAAGVPVLRARWPALDARKFLARAERAEADAAGWHALADGERVRAGDRDLVVLHTPGHAADHVCFWDPVARDLYAGDMLVRGGTVMVPARGGVEQGSSLRAYLASLRRLAALAPARVLPGHGPVIDAPVALIDDYLKHREMREQQVLAAIADGIADPDALVARIYPGLDAGLLPAARVTVEAHLEKLREDGRVPR